MKEKASSKESGEDSIPRVDPDAPGLPAGEELVIDPVNGDEIDPIRKWWDEAEATSREKSRNRRLEELEAGADGILDAEGRALPRRRKLTPPLTIELDDIPGLSGPKEVKEPASPAAEAEISSGVVREIAPEEEENDALSLDSFPVSALKRHARGESEGEAFDLSGLFAKANGDGEEGTPVAESLGAVEESAAVESVELAPAGPGMEKKAVLSDEEKEDLSLDLGDLLKPASADDPSALLFEFLTVKIDAVDDDAPLAADEVVPDEVEGETAAAGLKEEPKSNLPPLPKRKIEDLFKKEEPAEEVMAEVAPAKEESARMPIAVDEPAKKEPVMEAALTETTATIVSASIRDEDLAVMPPIAEPGATGEATNAVDAEVPPEKEPETETAVPADPEVKDGPKEAQASPVEPIVPESEPDSETLPAVLPAAAIEQPPVLKKSGCWTLFATLFFFATLLFIAGLGVAGWFAWSRLGDFENEVTTRVRSSLEERGIYLDYGTWSYQFPRGLVFDEVTIFDDATRQRPLIKAAGLGINVDLVGFVRTPGEVGAGEINLQDSTLTLFEAGQPVATIEGIDGEILTSGESVRVERLSALLGGWQVNLSGVVSLPVATATPPAAVGADAAPATAPLKLDISAFQGLGPWVAIESGHESAPVLNLTFAMDAAQPDLASIEGNLHGQDLTWHGIAFTSATATFKVIPETGELSVPSFQIGHGEGFVGGKLAIDTTTQRLRVEQLQSTVDAFALLGQFKSEWAETWKSIRLIDSPSIRISGEIPLDDPSQADLKVRYDHREGMVYTTAKGELPLRDLRGNFVVNRGSVETNDAGFELFGGAVQLNGATRLTNEARPFNGLIEITGLSLEKAAGFFGMADSGMSGRLSFVFRGVGYGDIQKIQGGGTLHVEEAVIPDFPVLGEIQDYVGRAVPAFGVKGQGNVTGAYIIESGVLVASDLTVANSAGRIVTNGSVNLSSLETTFTAKADLVPSLAAATGLTEKAITFEGKGPLADPTVVMKSFPIEFASVSLGSILGTSPRSLGTLQIVPGAKEAVAAFADQLGGPGVTIHPEVTTFFKTLLGEQAPAPEAAPAPPEQ